MGFHHLGSSLISGGSRGMSNLVAQSLAFEAGRALRSHASLSHGLHASRASRRVMLGAAGSDSSDYFYEDENPYPRNQDTRKQYAPTQKSILPKIKNQKQIGVTLVGLGAVFTLLGMLFFFEKNLLRIGNLCFLLGVTMFVGPNNLFQFFSQPNRIRAAVIVLFGAFMVFSGSPRFGILCQIFGLLNLFGNMFPFVLVMLRQIPLLGDFIAQAEEMARGIRRKYRAQSQSRMGGRARQDADYYDYPPSFQPKPSPSPKYYSEF